jgi:hypothetical protein
VTPVELRSFEQTLDVAHGQILAFLEPTPRSP